MRANKNFELDRNWILERKGKFISNKFSLVLNQILFQRGFEDEKSALEFLNPAYEDLKSPSKINEVDKAVAVIKNAVENKSKIAIYGDYDVDGLTATALMVNFLESIGANVTYYIPSRQTDGYGLNKKSIDSLRQENVDLIVTVDCGTSAISEVDYALGLGLDIIVTDHHDLEEKDGNIILPNCIVVNPKRNLKELAIYNLSGVGVAFYLIRALQKSFTELIPSGQEKWFLDLVALGTICDIVPLKFDNRVLVKYGLKVLKKSRNLGLQTIVEALEINPSTMDTYKIGFVIGPRLNAAGRMKEATESLSLLLSKDLSESTAIVAKLNDYNLKRQEETERIVGEAKAYIKLKKLDKHQKIILLKNKNWPAGIIGIAASRLVEEYNRPILIMEEGDKYLKGSARSIKGFNIIEALNECGEFFLKFGGHSQAAGFKLKINNFIALEKKIMLIAESKIRDEELIPKINIDCEIEFKEIGQDLIDELGRLEPYGSENRKPFFVSRRILISEINLVGPNKNHLKLVLDSTSGYSFTGMAFNYGSRTVLKVGDVIDIVYTLESNEWKNMRKINLYIIDLKISK
ncbi:MAG: single-stranded-DNA-specific exonuclease RecJ [bacterium]